MKKRLLYMQLLTECKTNYKKYILSVKSKFIRCQGNQMKYLRRNSPSEFYNF